MASIAAASSDRRAILHRMATPAEVGAGAPMPAGVAIWLSAPVALAIGGIGLISMLKAVHVAWRQPNCACVGGSGKGPLGFISLTGNALTVAMAIAMGVTLL